MILSDEIITELYANNELEGHWYLDPLTFWFGEVTEGGWFTFSMEAAI